MDYIVQEGDSLEHIAHRFKVKLDAVIRANPDLVNANLIRPGQKINVPVAGADQSYTIKVGDTLTSIARRHHVDVATLASENGLSHPDHIRAGKTLHFQGHASANVASAPSPATQVTSSGALAPAGLTQPTPAQALRPTSPPPAAPRPAPPPATPPAGGQTFTLQSLALAKAPHQQNHAFQQKMIDDVLPAARAAKLKYGVPVSVTLVQAALESSWGQKMKGGAAFGVKAPQHPPAGMRTVTFMTHEEDKKTGRRYMVPQTFIAYGSFAEAVDGYANFLKTNHRYHKAFENLGNPDRFLEEVVKAGYGTDGKYMKLATDIMKNSHMKDYD